MLSSLQAGCPSPNSLFWLLVRSHQFLPGLVRVLSCLSGSSEERTSWKEHCRVFKGKTVIGRSAQMKRGLGVMQI